MNLKAKPEEVIRISINLTETGGKDEIMLIAVNKRVQDQSAFEHCIKVLLTYPTFSSYLLACTEITTS